MVSATMMSIKTVVSASVKSKWTKTTKLSFNEKVGRDPDKGWVDQLVVVGADADDEEDAGGRGDG